MAKENKYEVWLEGFAVTGQSESAQRLTKKDESTLWEAETFQKACRKALGALRWELEFYNEKTNSYWGKHFE